MLQQHPASNTPHHTMLGCLCAWLQVGLVHAYGYSMHADRLHMMQAKRIKWELLLSLGVRSWCTHQGPRWEP